MGRLEARYPALTRNAPVILMGLAAVLSVIVLLALQSGMTFFQDEWNMVIHRTGFNAPAFFDPNDVHPVPLVVAIYKLCLEVFGMTSVFPERVISVLLYALTGILLFVYVRRRVGPWLALFPAVILLFLGPGANVLLWPFEMTLVGSLAAGIGALLALERDDGRGDFLACLLCVVALGCSSLGVSFALATGVDMLLKWRRRGLWRLWVPAVPLILYVIWYESYGHKSPSALSFSNIVGAPIYVAEAISSALSSLVGLNTASPSSEAFAHGTWGPALFVAALLLIALWLARGRPQIRPQILVVGMAAGSFWILSAFNYIPGREPTASRYQYIGVAMIVLLAAEIFRGYRPGRRTIAVLAFATAVILVSNITPLKDELKFFEQQSELSRGELEALEIARPDVQPGFSLTPDIASTASLTPVDATSYFDAVDAYGSPAADEAELLELEPGVLKVVDNVLVHALGISFESGVGNPVAESGGPAPVFAEGVAGVTTQESCLRIAPGAAASGLAMTLRGSTAIHIDAGAPATFGLWRFAPEAILTNQLEAGQTSLLTIPKDTSPYLWQSSLTTPRGATVCTEEQGAGSAG
jgi:hypothetical protein